MHTKKKCQPNQNTLINKLGQMKKKKEHTMMINLLLRTHGYMLILSISKAGMLEIEQQVKWELQT